MKKALLVLLIVSFCVASFAQTERISKPGVYSGYAKPVADGSQRFSQYVAVRDGVKLAVDFYRPTLKGQLVTTPFPVIWQFTPYRRALYDNAGNVISRQADTLLELTKYGYVIAVADVRGKGASFGFRKSMHGRQEVEDSYDLTEWFAAQSWSSGKVGMFGGSYNGGTVAGAVTAAPPHLKAVFFGITDFNMYNGWVRGGIMRYSVGADIFVVLEDVDEAGNAQYVADGRLRLSLRATHQPPYNFLNLPWHRNYKIDEHKLTPDKPVKVAVDLMPTVTIFKKGHRIRLALTGSQGRTNHRRASVAPTLNVLRDAIHVSYLSLPITKQ